MQDLCALSKKHILIVICNPLFNNAVSNIQNRLIDKVNFDYGSTYSFYKQVFSSNKQREDIHRPLGFYEELFKRYNLKIKNIIQTIKKYMNIDKFTYEYEHEEGDIYWIFWHYIEIEKDKPQEIAEVMIKLYKLLKKEIK